MRHKTKYSNREVKVFGKLYDRLQTGISADEFPNCSQVFL